LSNSFIKSYFKYAEPENICNSLIKYSMLKPKTLELPVEKSLGYRIAEDLIALNNIPSHNISHFDGYAIKGLECNKYRVIKCSPNLLNHLEPCEAIFVATGFPVPNNADAVVPLENVRVCGEDIVVYGNVRKGFGIVYEGSDVKKGQVIIKRGEVLNPIHIKILLELGVEYVRVYEPIKTSIISVGREFISKEKRETLSFLTEYLITMFSLGIINKKTICNDDINEIAQTLRKELETSDIIIVLGGASIGVNDYSYKALSGLNPSYTFRGIKVQPGRVTSGGIVSNKIVFLLPGLIQSMLSGMLFIVMPTIMHLYGTQLNLPFYYALLSKDYEFNEFVSFRRLRFIKLRGNKAEIIESVSAHMSPILNSDGFIIIDKYVRKLEAGSIIKVYTIPYLIVGKNSSESLLAYRPSPGV